MLMLKHQLVRLAFLAASPLVLSACDNDDPVQPETPAGTVVLQLEHVMAEQPLELQTGRYTTANNDTISVSSLLYYLSNVKLQNDNGSQVYAEPESYHLVNEKKPESKKITLGQVTPGTYTRLYIAIGIDNNRNHTGAQTGDLSPDYGMIWTWESGYKFLVLEGNSPQSRGFGGTYAFHIGNDRAYRWLALPLPAPLEVKKGSKHTIHLKADIRELFSSPRGNINLNTNFNHQAFDSVTARMADRYPRVFKMGAVDSK